jgi:YD repeat-containing protein
MKMMLTAIVLALSVTAASAQQTRFYAPDGKSIGTAVPYGNGSVRYYDSRGNSLGTSTTTGNTTRFYDAGGRSTGSTSGPVGRGPLGSRR